MRWRILSFLTCIALAGGAQEPFAELPSDDVFNLNHAWGLAIGDYDNDGDDDIFVPAEPSRLLINQGNGEFIGDNTNFTNLIAKVAVWADINDDGWLDLIASSWESSGIFINQGDGSFEQEGSLPRTKRQAFLVGDLNGDQWIDIYTSNFRQENELYLNDGGGQLVNLVAGSGAVTNQSGMGGLLVDFDQDGDLDIYLVFDGQESNHLLLNDGSGSFTESAALYGMDTRTQGMGTDYADFNGDGRYDYYITNLFHNNFMVSQPDGTYADLAPSLGMDDNGMAWGLVVLDYNNDGFPDIYVNNKYGFSPFPNQFYRNNGDMTFDNIAPGSALENKMAGFGCGAADLDGDGLQDLIVINEDDEKSVRIFRNTSGATGNWIQLSLVGKTINKFAVGSKISIYSGEREWRRELTLGSGYSTQNSYRMHFSLGDEDHIDSVVIRWPDGTTGLFENVSTNQRYLVIQDELLQPFDVGAYQTALINESQLGPAQGVPSVEIVEGDYSIARTWNEALLYAIRNDLARPTVHSRNLFHSSMAMYDLWTVYTNTGARPVFLGKSFQGFTCPFEGINQPEETEAAMREAISYAMYHLLRSRFRFSPGSASILRYLDLQMSSLGYDINYYSLDYVNGPPAALGIYLATKIIEFGHQDGSNEAMDYANLYYQPVNDPLDPTVPGNSTITNPNRWQPLSLDNFIDQSGIPRGEVPPFIGAEWGRVKPFSLSSKELTIKEREGSEYWVYHDPGPPPSITDTDGFTDDYKWNHTMVAIWSGQLDASSGVMIDISPASNGNNTSYPTTQDQFRAFYNYMDGGDLGAGYDLNPITGAPYTPQVVPLGDYARVLAEFWADGPDSETPPGHWFTILNYVSDHPDLVRRFGGSGTELSPLEWDIKSYLMMGGAMHDVAITAWGIKGYYDYVRPVSAIRYMAEQGQSSDRSAPFYNPHGIPLVPGKIEQVAMGDPLAGPFNENVNKIKLFAWKGPGYINNPDTDIAGTGWILAENWWPYQRPSFVTPPFAGYISGHSTFSSAGAEILSLLTGSEYFPGGLGEFVAPENEFLVFEEGPSMDITLQWARYRDASDHSSISRIWGGIHPPVDDIPGRNLGITIGQEVFDKATAYFTNTITSLEPVARGNETYVYPNPVRGGTYVNLSTNETVYTAILVDISGRQVARFDQNDFTDGIVQLPVLPRGLYLLQLNFKNHSQSLRLAIE